MTSCRPLYKVCPLQSRGWYWNHDPLNGQSEGGPRGGPYGIPGRYLHTYMAQVAPACNKMLHCLLLACWAHW